MHKYFQAMWNPRHLTYCDKVARRLQRPLEACEILDYMVAMTALPITSAFCEALHTALLLMEDPVACGENPSDKPTTQQTTQYALKTTGRLAAVRGPELSPGAGRAPSAAPCRACGPWPGTWGP